MKRARDSRNNEWARDIFHICKGKWGQTRKLNKTKIHYGV